MVPWAKRLRATVISVVSKKARDVIARLRGCDAVLVWGNCDVPAEVYRLFRRGRQSDADLS